ncbi:MAG: T9SS type A sorting domain-containing protein [Bacteroidetes bacterium]|nr:T9SS type A sorting domain-containing protein [Bacteroidota bacterium]
MKTFTILCITILYSINLFAQGYNVPAPRKQNRTLLPSLGKLPGAVVNNAINSLKSVPILSEDFESVTPPALPAGWTTAGNAGSDFFQTGDNTTASSTYFSIPAHTKFAYTNDDNCNCDKDNDVLNFPVLNFTGKSNMTLSFAAFTFDPFNDPQYMDSSFVQASTDGGTTWTTIFTFPKSPNWGTYLVSLSAFNNLPNVLIRLFYRDYGTWGYGLAIDDISIDVITDNIGIGGYVYLDQWMWPEYAQIPVNQLDTVTFIAEIYNSTSTVETGVNLTVEEKIGTTVVYQATSADSTLTAFDTAVFTVNPPLFSNSLGNYTVTFTSSIDNIDEVPVDDQITETFTVTDTIFSRDNDQAQYQLTAKAFGLAGPYELANLYDITNADTATSISFELGPNTVVGTTIQGKIWDVSVDPAVEMGSTDFYTIASADIGTFPAFVTKTLPIITPSTGVPLAENSSIFVSIVDFSGTDSATAIIAHDAPNGGYPTSAPGYIYSGQWYYINYTPFIRLNLTMPAVICPVISTTVTTASDTCNSGKGNASVSPSGGTSPYTFAWSNGNTTSIATGLTAGSYAVTVTDNKGCGVQLSVSVPDASPMTATTSVTGDTCSAGVGDAMVNAANGTSPYSYSWSNGATTSANTDVVAGDYTVTVTDAVGCTVVKNATIDTVDSGLQIDSLVTVDASCGLSDGSASVYVSGYGSPFSYNWSNGGTSATITGLAPDYYDVYVTDLYGCTDSSTTTVSSGGLGVNISNTVDVACYGDATGSATVSPTGGNQPYSYLWSNGQTNATATGLIAGTYTATVTDSSGCYSPKLVTINQPAAALSSTVSGTDVDCKGQATGAIDLTVSGGTPGYTYMWIRLSDTTLVGVAQDLTGLTADTYACMISDAKGCSDTSAAVFITEPATAVAITDTVVTPEINNQNNGTITVVVSGGATPYTYNWIPNVITGPSGTGLSSGNYSVTVYDANACSVTLLVNVPVGIEENFPLTRFDIIPNPNNGIFFLTMKNVKKDNYSFEIRNILGQVVMSETTPVSGSYSKVYDLTNYNKGVYFLKISNGKEQRTEKVVIF